MAGAGGGVLWIFVVANFSLAHQSMGNTAEYGEQINGRPGPLSTFYECCPHLVNCPESGLASLDMFQVRNCHSELP
jgi:hypothetical protein